MEPYPVKLVTATGGFVAMTECIPFNKWPDVITWGLRVFVPVDLPMPGAAVRALALYREAFTFACPVKE